MLWTAISRQRVNENKCINYKVLVIHSKNTNREKVTRANGGCLGFWRRRRTRQAAKSDGDLPTRNDPSISEWGNPYS